MYKGNAQKDPKGGVDVNAYLYIYSVYICVFCTFGSRLYIYALSTDCLALASVKESLSEIPPSDHKVTTKQSITCLHK